MVSGRKMGRKDEVKWTRMGNWTGGRGQMRNKKSIHGSEARERMCGHWEGKWKR
jgi:hypothetical protein